MYDVDFLRSVFEYKPDTGEFVRKKAGLVTKGKSLSSTRRRLHLVVSRNGSKKSLLAHRVAWTIANGAIPDGLEIDHINGDEGDNRLANLRLATRSENQWNKKKHRVDNKCKLLGVDMIPNGSYRAQIKKNKKTIYLGLFKTPEEAHQAYMKAKTEIHKREVAG